MTDKTSIAQLPCSSGIYAIVFQDRKRYVGSSVNIHRRLLQHINDLVKSKHCNPKLQRYFNKYGIDNFSIRILELTQNTYTNLVSKEEYYIQLFKSCTKKHGFNLSSKADRPPTHINKKKFILCNTNNELIKFSSLTEFSNVTGIEMGRASEILCKKRNNYKGWRLPDTDRIFKYRLRDVAGAVHHFDNMNDFAILNNLDFKGINYLLRGIYRHHRGWTCPRHEWVILDKNNCKHIVNCTIKSFCEKMQLPSRAKFNAVLTGKLHNYKGWRLP